MYFVYGCPKVFCLQSQEESPTIIPNTNAEAEEILAIAFNSSGSLLAIASTSRLCLWSGGKDHVPLGSLAIRLRGLSSGGTSLLWRRDSGVVGVVSDAGKLVLASVSRKEGGAKPVGDRFAVPDWFEPQHARVPTEDESAEDPWADPAEANVSVKALVDQIFSDISSMCLGRFGQNVLVSTTDGEIYGVSWEGQILCRYGIITMPTASPRNGGGQGPRSSPTQTRFADVCASSMSFNDTLQLLALTTTDGSFFLGTLSKDQCWLRSIAVTEQAIAHRQQGDIPAAAARVSAALQAPAQRFGQQQRQEQPAGVGAAVGGDFNARGRSGSWNWSLWGRGKEAVVAAAAAAADVLSSPPTSQSGIEGTSVDGGFAAGPGRWHRGGATTDRLAGLTRADDKSGTGAVGVEFSDKGCLLAIALVDGTVLLTRVERYTSGVRAHHQLQISNSMLHRSDSYRLQVPSEDIFPAGPSGVGEPQENGGGSEEDSSRRTGSKDARSGSMSSLWGVEVHHLHCLSLQPWVGDGNDTTDRAVTGPAGRVLSMCFSFDGWALSVGHEHALTVWSTEDGTRLMCTLSETSRRRETDGHTSRARGPATPIASARNVHNGVPGATDTKRSNSLPLPSSNGEAPTANCSGKAVEGIRGQRGGEVIGQGGGCRQGNGSSGGGGEKQDSAAPKTRRTLDLVAGGARSLTWGSEGYRLLSVGGSVGRDEEEGKDGRKPQGIVAFDFLRRSRSNLSSALLSLQGSDRIALVDSQPWSAQVLLWRVLPVHPGYLSTNAPVRHVSTSRAGTYVAVAGSRGLAMYSRPTNRWRLFGNIEQEREVEVAGMCWWGESALVVASRLKHGFILLLYSRKHLDSQSLLLPPIRLPVGMRPLFIQGVQEGGSKPGTDVLFLLVAGSTSYLLYRFSYAGDVLERGSVSFSVLHEGALPHVLENMDDMRQLDQIAGLGRGSPPLKTTTPSITTSGASQDDPDAIRDSKGIHPSPARAGGVEIGKIEAAGEQQATPAVDAAASPAAAETETEGIAGDGVGDSSSNGAIPDGGERLSSSSGFTGAGRRVKASGLPEIGPPKRVMLLPEVHPRSIALLDYDGNLVTMQLSNGEVQAVAEGVESVVDLSGVSEAWEAWEMPLLVHPCYLLRRRGRVGGGGGGGAGRNGWGRGPAENGGSEEMSEEYSVWCPAMRLDPCPPSVQSLLRGGGGVRGQRLSPVLSLDQGAGCDPERVDLGLQPLLGTMVHVSQVVCRPRVANTPALPPCYELRTHLRPILHMVLRHLLIVNQLQLLASPPAREAETVSVDSGASVADDADTTAAAASPDMRRQRASLLTGTGTGIGKGSAGQPPTSGGLWQHIGGGGGGRGSEIVMNGRGAVGGTGSASGEGGRGGDGGSQRGIRHGQESENGLVLSNSNAARVGSDAVSSTVSDYDRPDATQREDNGVGGKARRGVGFAEEAEEAAEGACTALGRGRDWIGTNSDAFEIAVAVLKRCREDDVLVEALPDTLELLVRACMSALNLAGPRARKQAAAAAAAAAAASQGDSIINNTNKGSSGSSGAAVSELELARAVMADCVYLAQLAPECFHEVVARVARKAEPELYSLLFPLHLVSDGLGSGCNNAVEGLGAKAGANCDVSTGVLSEEREKEAEEGAATWGRWVHPTHLFHECVSTGKLTTAAWYLPLVRDDIAYSAAQRDAGANGPLSDEERARFMPLEMWSLLSKDWSCGLSHALACVLMAESLASKQHEFLPEVWLFARKREQSAPLHLQYNDQDGTDRPNKNDRSKPNDHYWSSGDVYRTSWWSRGEGAARESAKFKADAAAKEHAKMAAARESSTQKKSKGRRNSGDGNSFGSGVLGKVSLSWALGKDAGLPALEDDEQEALLKKGGRGWSEQRETLFDRRSALRFRALRRPVRLGDADSPVIGNEGDEHVQQSGVAPATERVSPTANVQLPQSANFVPQLESLKRMESERSTLYHLPFSRNAASVVSRFLWKQLNELKVKIVLRAFQSLASSPAALEAGLDPGKVLGALSPARRSMVGKVGRMPEEIMAGLVVALAEMFKMSVGELALMALPSGRNHHKPSQKDENGRHASSPTAEAGNGDAARPLPLTQPADGKPKTMARQQRLATAAATVRLQLELLGDLSRAVGHGEAALLCASLLRDRAGGVEILRNASQTLRVGYGHFVSDLAGQLQKAREKAAALAPPSEAVASPSLLPQNPPQNGTVADLVGTKTSNKRAVTSSSFVDTEASITSKEGTAAALLGLQRFGGDCVRSLAEGSAYA